MGLEGQEGLKMGLRHQGGRTGLAEEEQARRVGRRTCLCGIQGSTIDMVSALALGSRHTCALAPGLWKVWALVMEEWEGWCWTMSPSELEWVR